MEGKARQGRLAGRQARDQWTEYLPYLLVLAGGLEAGHDS